MLFDTVFRIASLSVNSEAAGAFRLSFRSPTHFVSLGSGYHWMFPGAVKVFSGLMRCWNLFSDGRRFSKEEYVAYREWLGKNCRCK
jgi:hypothetical protein